jgi:outer membrane immunogenic protein
MKSWVNAAGIVALLAVEPANAADMPVKAPPVLVTQDSWSGFYVGAHAGYLWGRTRAEFNGVVIEANAPTNGFVGGGLAGWRWQRGAFVFGIEGDFGWTDANGVGGIALVTYTYDFNWTAHVRGQAGYSFGPLLVFVAGGAAFADFDFRRNTGAIVGTVFTGGSVGGGVEYALSRTISGRLEYLYDHFGSKTYDIAGFLYPVRLKGSTLRGAINVKLGNPS